MDTEYLQYYIRETRQQSVSRRDEQQEDMLDYLKWLLAKALNSDQTVAPPSLAWHLAATELHDRLEAVLWYGMADGPPHLIVHVSSGEVPRCEASREGAYYGRARTGPRPSWTPATWSKDSLGRGWKAAQTRSYAPVWTSQAERLEATPAPKPRPIEHRKRKARP